jgi:predicted DNA-binding transcriptional regulator YafY
MGVRVEVLEPEELREKIVERARAVVGRATV